LNKLRDAAANMSDACSDLFNGIIGRMGGKGQPDGSSVPNGRIGVSRKGRKRARKTAGKGEAVKPKIKRAVNAKDPAMPKKPVSVYIAFQNANMATVRKEMGSEATIRQVMDEIKTRWRALSDAEKQVVAASSYRLDIVAYADPGSLGRLSGQLQGL
jgi:hypothetical protein